MPYENYKTMKKKEFPQRWKIVTQWFLDTDTMV